MVPCSVLTKRGQFVALSSSSHPAGAAFLDGILGKGLLFISTSGQRLCNYLQGISCLCEKELEGFQARLVVLLRAEGRSVPRLGGALVPGSEGVWSSGACTGSAVGRF